MERRDPPPVEGGGFGLPIAQTDAGARSVEAFFDILYDIKAMHGEWRRLVARREVKGVQVHDARFAASAVVGGCRAILTLSDPDFKRFGVPALHPRDAAAFLETSS